MFGRAALQVSVEKGDYYLIKSFLEAGVSFNALASEIHGRTALQAAKEKEDSNLIKCLLDSGLNINGLLGKH